MIAWVAFAYVNGALACIAALWALVQLARAYQWHDAHQARQRRANTFRTNLNAAARGS